MAIAKSDPHLWEALAALPLDRLAEEDTGPQNGFTLRLMKQEGWDYTHSVRVVAEYRRFLYLAALGEVSPPPDVDAAWHLHLTYTRAYWTGLCERTLGHALDHYPSTGATEAVRYKTVYTETRRRYRDEFGCEPPADIWLDPEAPSHGAHPLAESAARVIAIVVTGTVALWLAPGLVRAIGVVGVFMLAFVALVIVSSAHGRTRRDSNGGGGDISFGLDAGEGGDGGSCGGGCGGD